MTAVPDRGIRTVDSTVDTTAVNIDAGVATAGAGTVTEFETGGSGVEVSDSGTDSGSDSATASNCGPRCDGICYSCDIEGQGGICALVPDGMDPNDNCGSCSVCDGEGNCRPVGANEPDPKGICPAGDTTGECGENGMCDGEGHRAYKLAEDSNGGCLLWTEQIGTNATEYAFGIATDISGNIYLTSSTYGGLDGNTNSGNSDIFVVKYSSAGDKVWTRQLGTSAQDAGYDIATDASGNVYLTGYTEGILDGNTNSGDSDIFVVKYSSAGDELWTRQLGTSYWDNGEGIATDTSGNVYLTGEAGGGLDGNANLGAGDIFVIKYSSEGDELWIRQLGTSAMERGHSIATDASGNVYLTGETKGSLYGNANAGEWDIFLFTMTGTGE